MPRHRSSFVVAGGSDTTPVLTRSGGIRSGGRRDGTTTIVRGQWSSTLDTTTPRQYCRCCRRLVMSIVIDIVNHLHDQLATGAGTTMTVQADRFHVIVFGLLKGSIKLGKR